MDTESRYVANVIILITDTQFVSSEAARLMKIITT